MNGVPTKMIFRYKNIKVYMCISGLKCLIPIEIRYFSSWFIAFYFFKSKTRIEGFRSFFIDALSVIEIKYYLNNHFSFPSNFRRVLISFSRNVKSGTSFTRSLS